MDFRLNEAVCQAKVSGIREFSRLAAQRPGCVALTLGEPEYDTPAPVREAAKEALDRGETHYIENNGSWELRKAVACFEKERKGLSYDPDEVIITAGATEGIFISLFGILNPGDEVIVPTPAFSLYKEIINLCRGKYVELPTEEDGFSIDGEKLKKQISSKTKAIILNSPNNPTGTVYERESLKAVAEAVKDKPIFVICDDVYDQLVYEEGYESFSSYGAKEGLKRQILVVQSFSKPYAMTGWRMGYLMGDRQVMEKLQRIHQYMIVSTPAPFQNAAVTALRQDGEQMRQSYKMRRNYMTARLKEMGLPAVMPKGAFYVFPSVKRFGISSEDFCRRMIEETGLAATPGIYFGAEGYIRLTYCYKEEEIKEGLDRLEHFVHILEKEMEEEKEKKRYGDGLA